MYAFLHRGGGRVPRLDVIDQIAGDQDVGSHGVGKTKRKQREQGDKPESYQAPCPRACRIGFITGRACICRPVREMQAWSMLTLMGTTISGQGFSLC